MYDIIVIGGGHAGVEASLAASRMGNKTLMICGAKHRISNMPCNPSIGGPAKGVIVREIDALGGEMGRGADKTLLQIKMLNSSKGPAVRALRCQSDKVEYPKYMQSVVYNQKNLEVREDLVTALEVKDDTIKGVYIKEELIECKACIITTGTYLDSRCLIGHEFWQSGPDNEKTTNKLSESLKSLGVELIRLKTGTPPRIQTDSIDFSKTKLEPGDTLFYHFSDDTTSIRKYEDQVPCYLTHTTKETHKIILDNLDKSAMYGGVIEGIGPRYCPSIETKVMRFKDKESHQVFLEPESLSIDETYLQGLSTSMPRDVQEQMVHSLPGLENAIIRKYSYAIEYDAINPLQLKRNLELKKIHNLFFAGQVNGTSGYEEAAGQGIYAGINASLKIQGKEPFILGRDESYIGVLVDDLINKGVKDPYRLLTSRAEYRLLLRHDNASDRLLKYGYDFGLISEERYNKFLEKRSIIESIKEKLKEIKVNPKNEYNSYLLSNNKSIINITTSCFDLLRRPDLEFSDLKNMIGIDFDYPIDILDQAMIEIKYEGYIQKAYKEASKLKQMESRKIPSDIDYNNIKNLASEAKEKLI